MGLHGFDPPGGVEPVNNQQLGLFLLCLTCGTPFLIGLGLGIYLERHLTRDGWIGLLVPRFIRDYIERLRDGL